jgi:hypothetical protein
MYATRVMQTMNAYARKVLVVRLLGHGQNLPHRDSGKTRRAGRVRPAGHGVAKPSCKDRLSGIGEGTIDSERKGKL